MSLTKLLMAPIKLFKKDVITFLIIRRYDLDMIEDKLRYIAVKPTASISTLRQKVWHLLDLPDYCEEIIILKSNDVEIPLTELRKGNDPQRPYVLEVWLPATTTIHNMLTMGHSEVMSSLSTCEEKSHDYNGKCVGHDANNYLLNFNFKSDRQRHVVSEFCIRRCTNNQIAKKGHVQFIERSQDSYRNFMEAKSAMSTETVPKEAMPLNKLNFLGNQPVVNNFKAEYKKSELSCRISSSSLIFNLRGKKSKDNFASILLKIQSDISSLSNKLSKLENRIPT